MVAGARPELRGHGVSAQPTELVEPPCACSLRAGWGSAAACGEEAEARVGRRGRREARAASCSTHATAAVAELVQDIDCSGSGARAHGRGRGARGSRVRGTRGKDGGGDIRTPDLGGWMETIAHFPNADSGGFLRID